jgi:uncharacterized protein YyaL (SSP411 family)
MHHDRSKKVLFVAMEAKKIADTLRMDMKKLQETIVTCKNKLLKERDKRESPFVDKTFYSSINGMLITAYLKAYRVLKDRYLKDFALNSLERMMKNHFIKNELFHTEGVKALLDDYIYLIEALISAYEVAGDPPYLNSAEKLMNLCIKKFWDNNEGGFFDTEEEVIGLRLRGIEDIPHPSANSVAIILLLKLFHITGKATYQEYAEKALKIFSVRAQELGIHSSYYFCAMDSYFNMMKLTIDASPECELTGAALSFLVPYLSISYGEDKGRIIPCFKNVCHEPIDRPESLKDFLMNLPPSST